MREECTLIKPRLEYEEGRPTLKYEVNGMPITLSFVEETPETNTKEEILGIITEQYKIRLTAGV